MSAFSESKLPTSFLNEIETFSSDSIVVRSNIQNLEDCNKWVKEYGELTRAKFNTRTSKPCGKRFACSKKFVCHHSCFMKVPPTENKRRFSKNLNCQASIHIKVKLSTAATKRKDSFVQKGLPAVVTIHDVHNHNMNTAEALKFLPTNTTRCKTALNYQMPSTCCVPGCKSNYKTKENVRVFKFPADAETKDKWLKEIQRKDFVPGSRSAVCIFHFKDEDVVREDVFTDPDGTIKVYERERYKLKKNAVPCIFPYIPTSDVQALRKLKGKGRERKLKSSNAETTEFLDVDIISNFRELVERTDIIKESWCTYVEDLRITYYKLEPNSSPLHIRYSFTIDTNLRISIFCREKKIDCKDMFWLFCMDEEKQLVLERYSQLENLFVYLDHQKNAHFLLF